MGALLFCVILFAGHDAASAAATDPDQPKKVLIIYSYHEKLPWQMRFRQGFTAGLTKWGKKIELYEESMDFARFSASYQIKDFYEHLKQKYSGKRLDLLVTESSPASGVLLGHSDFFPGVPRLYVNPDPTRWAMSGRGLDSWAIVVNKQIIKSFDSMLSLTKATRVAVVGETSTPHIRKMVEAIRQLRPSGRNGVEVDYLLDLTLDELKDRVGKLPSDNPVFFLLVFRDRNGAIMTPYDTAEVLANSSPAPIFCHWDSMLGSGVLGGYMLSSTRVGEIAADEVMILLSGGEPDKVKEREKHAYAYMYDWRALQRYGIDSSSLPEGSEILFKMPSLWTEYRYYAIGAVLLIVLLTFMTTSLAYVVVQRRMALRALKNERALLEDRVARRTNDLFKSNQRLSRLLTEISANNKTLENTRKELQRHIELVNRYVIILIVDRDGLITFASEELCRISGYDKAELIGESARIFQHEDLGRSLDATIENTLLRGEVWAGEIPSKGKDGKVFWLELKITANVNPDWTIAGSTVIGQDITDRKKIEELSVTDGLTKLLNRMKLDRELDREVERSSRYGHSFSVIMLDVDHFKKVNDTYGHQAGDQVLIGIGELLKNNIRKVDIPGRWGGEEFLIICPETNSSQAQVLAEKLRLAMAERDFPIVGRKTGSFGVAMHISGETGAATVNRADDALYQAKKLGRNRVVVADAS